MEAGLGNRWKKQVRTRHAPEHLASRSGRNAGYEECGRGPVDRPSAAAGDLMERTEGKPSSRQGPIDLRNAEWQNLPYALRTAFQLADALAEFRQHGIEGMIGHGGIVAPSGFAAVL